jgi:predicted AAA+ superfamily ATPase
MITKEILKSVIYTQQEEQQLISHEVIRTQLATVDDYVALPHAVIICGLRRSGKSTFMRQVQQKHYPQGIYTLTFEDERLLGFTADDFSLLHEVFIELQGEKKEFAFDEIQNVENWEVFVRRMINQGYKFYITGSNAAMLSQELGTRLTGRNITLELFPYSFVEYLQFKQMAINEKTFFLTNEKAKIKTQFNQFVIHGGMPEYLQYDNVELLTRNYEDILFRDIIARHKIKDIPAFRRLSLYLFNNFATRITYNSLKSILGIANTTTISNYVYYLESSYLIFTLNQFSYSLKQQNLLPKKIYVIDNGMAHSIALQFSENKGRYLENCVFLELKRRYQEIYYYQTAEQFEVDFVVFEKGKAKKLIQVCYQLEQETTKTRELRALLSAMDELGITEGMILTDDQTDILTVDNKKISIISVYQWLLT